MQERGRGRGRRDGRREGGGGEHYSAEYFLDTEVFEVVRFDWSWGWNERIPARLSLHEITTRSITSNVRHT